ncbi:MAG: amidohydrolase family protein [Hyphomicrobiaceae bacterium]|nr:MAG: amidohydrolase family protein [Hyphomicrobiaceae bacterium]
MATLDEDKIDCHVHILDPIRYPYESGTPYRPSGQEIGTPSQLAAICETFKVRHCLLVGPNSGYGLDSRILLDAIEAGGGKYKGVAVVPNDAGKEILVGLQARGIVGVAVNATFHSVEYYRDIGPLMGRLADLDLFLQVQAEKEQWAALLPLLERAPCPIVIDHCGRPDGALGVNAAGFQAMLRLAAGRRNAVKLSGVQKISRQDYPHADARPFIEALLSAFGPERCVWASDWPFLRATSRVDYGPLLALLDRLLPDPKLRRAILWDTPRRLFGFR